MSNEERRLRNLPRFSWELSIGDIIQILVVVVLAVNLYDRVQEHDKRLAKHDDVLAQQATELQSLDQKMAVMQDRAARGLTGRVKESEN